MANTTSGTYVFEKGFSISDIVEEAYERVGMRGVSGYELKSAKRSLNILFQEWGNRGLHYWEVAHNSISFESGKNVYTLYRSTSDGTSDAMFSPLASAMTIGQNTVVVDSVANFPTTGTLLIGTEQITYTGITTNTNTFTGCTRGANGTTAATHSADDKCYDNASFTYGVTDILEASFRNSSIVDSPFTKVDRSTYQAFSNKTATGQPSQYFVERFIDRVTITVYLTPGASQVGSFLNYYYERRIQDAGVYSNDADVPYRFVPCMVAGLAYYLSQKVRPETTQALKLLYEDELARALAEDGSPSSTFISPKTYYPGT
jgi:hypothetical protein